MGKIDYIHTVQPGTGGIDDAFLNRYVKMAGSRRTEEGWDDASPYRPFGRTTITKRHSS